MHTTPTHEAYKIFVRSISISHVAGKDIATADVLSRAPVSSGVGGLQEEEIYVDSVIASLLLKQDSGKYKNIRAMTLSSSN